MFVDFVVEEVKIFFDVKNKNSDEENDNLFKVVMAVLKDLEDKVFRKNNLNLL